MHFKTIIASAAALLVASVSAAPQDVGILVATDPVSACNCPNNCDYTVGTGCRFYAGPSDTSDIISGTCANRGGDLTCIA